jgi:hypothetical protein
MKATKISALSCAIILACSGCYMQRPLETTLPPASTRIVADLTDAGTVAMGNALGSGVLKVEGVVTTASDDVWSMQMLRAEHRDGRSIDWNRELVSFPRNALTNPSIVVLDKKRSYLAAAGITLGAFVLANAFNLLGASEEDENTTPPAQSWVPGSRR